MNNKAREEEGLKHIHEIMHVFIEGLASGVYTSVEDVQADACQYLAMEEAVKRLANWNENSSVNDLANIFDGIANSIAVRKQQEEEEKEWQEITEMPKMEEVAEALEVSNIGVEDAK